VIEEVGEEIDVIARFQDGKITPVKFRWGGRTYFVVRVPFRWLSREGEHPQFHFSVTATSGDIFELKLDSRRMRWGLEKVMIEG